MLHTTAAYLPEKLQPEEAAGFKDLVSSAVNLYPGDGGRRIGAMGPLQRLAAVAVVLAVLAITGVDGWRSRASISLTHKHVEARYSARPCMAGRHSGRYSVAMHQLVVLTLGVLGGLLFSLVSLPLSLSLSSSLYLSRRLDAAMQVSCSGWQWSALEVWFDSHPAALSLCLTLVLVFSLLVFSLPPSLRPFSLSLLFVCLGFITVRSHRQVVPHEGSPRHVPAPALGILPLFSR
jgi:hypothetical protein